VALAAVASPGGLAVLDRYPGPLNQLRTAFRDGRFLMTLLLGNFAVMPAVITLLLLLLPDSPAIRPGVLLVLLVPCTHWFISFTHLGRGDTALAMAATPVLLLLQLLVLELTAVLGHLLLVFVLFLLAAACLGTLLGRVCQLKAPASRALTFSLGTRNSFMVLPLALALPHPWRGQWW
jgi:arsenite transporter